MNIVEARRSRHLVIRIDRGEELPKALQRALDEVEARAAWITGSGLLEAAELTVYDQTSRDYGHTHRIDAPSTLVSLAGNAALVDGAISLRLTALIAREVDTGLQLAAGELTWARAFTVELHVVALDDVALARAIDERTGMAGLTWGALQVSAARAPVHSGGGDDPPPPQLPNRPSRPRDEVEFYPEPGDLVDHFHFGECEVMTSDGDRIRLRQDKDGRVREVALTMLKIESPTVHASGKRHFRLSRKN